MNIPVDVTVAEQIWNNVRSDSDTHFAKERDGVGQGLTKLKDSVSRFCAPPEGDDYAINEEKTRLALVVYEFALRASLYYCKIKEIRELNDNEKAVGQLLQSLMQQCIALTKSI